VVAAGSAVALLMVRVAAADTAYVSDELILGVFAEENNQGQRLATLHSGASVETLSSNGDFTQVRLGDGITGWVKSAYLTSKEPATVRLKHLEEELDQARATTPALAQAATRSELESLRRQLELKQAQLDALHTVPSTSGSGTAAAPAAADAGALPGWWPAAGGLLAGLAVGFGSGYAMLARRVRQKFGGIKVY
jgi:hypothetical protein